MSHPSRRFFLGAASALAATRVWGANDKINVGIVGLGGRGTNHLDIYTELSEARVVALCDVNQAALEKAQATLVRKNHDRAKEYTDMRQAFADANVEAVSIATPNHWHALAAIWAMRAGKDVYGEKPACHNIYEGQTMLKVARETKRMLQIGSQHRSTPHKIRAMAALQSGLIGNVYLAKGLCFKRRLSIGHADDSPTPPGVNWDLFLGPAPMRPFNEKRFKYDAHSGWHWFWDTGNGDVGNQGVHEMGVCRWAFGDPEWPKTAYAQGGKFAYVDDQETPNTLLASYDYGSGREIVFEVRGLITGGEGTVAARRTPPATARPDAPAPTATAPRNAAPMNVMIGNLFYGTDGWAAMSDQGFQAFKGDSNELVMEERPERVQGGGDATGLHMQNFLAACKSRNYKELHDEIGNAYLSASMCHLANISYRVGRKLTLTAGPKFAGDPEADKLLTRNYRKPYVVA